MEEKRYSSQQEDVISLVDIIVIFIKYWKMWLTIVLCGVVVTIGLACVHHSKYTFTQQVSIPSYYNYNSVQQPILASDMVNNVLTKTQDQMIRANESNSKLSKLLDAMKIIPVSDKQTSSTSFMLSIIGTEREKQDYEHLFNDYVKSVASNATLTEEVSLWQKNLQTNIDNLTQVIEKSSSDMNLSSLYLRKNDLQIAASNMNPNFKQLSGLEQSIKSVGLSMKIILVLGVFLTLLVATFLVFLRHGIVTLMREVSVKVKQNNAAK